VCSVISGMIQQVSPAESDATSAEDSRATVTYAFGRCDYCGQGQRVVCRRLSGGASPLLIGCAPIEDLGECNSVSLLNGLDLRDRLSEIAVKERTPPAQGRAGPGAYIERGPGTGRTSQEPAAMMLMAEGATVTVCHHMTRSVAIHSRRADAVLVAVGNPDFCGVTW